MPLDFAYRPIDLPAALPQQRAVAAKAVPEGAILQGPVLVSEPRPRDFAARVRRRDMRSIRRALRGPSVLRQRLAGVAVFGLLATVLSPIGWGEPGGVRAATARVQMAGLQPFERGGESFPGSAFYWLDTQDSGLIEPTEAQSKWDQAKWDQSKSDADIGSARPILATGTTEDRWRALQCLTTAIYYEAASEPDAGQRAVAQVVLNRVAHPAWPNTVCGVVYQGSERPSCQFSFACDGSLARKPMKAFWDRARRVAADALAGNVYAPVGLATHYHTTAVHPYWAPSLSFIGTIGAHRFYNWAGAAGKPSAFTARYAGREPIAAPHPRTWTPSPADIADPLALEKAFEAGKIAAASTSVVGPAPAYAAPLLQRGGDAVFRAQGLPGLVAPVGKAPNAGEAPASGSGSVLPGHEGASQWIAQPRA
ncbi:MAG: cell wall hydrolase [Novosphingobium sp. 28-62-57]|uniref:cell wall hydrolase n=1 Tax=Novosphingobium sp. 28-62-57 TaxID=1970409 RepID=UPI000BD4DB8F|nr:cell wall hydrolase [Novosphingobium sp. 28-62-57]OYW50889.1 MAG: cell wall hydrolase [Novosphingobium sp. 12-62-10]OYZ09973.1 MAG: cell wall hydrolase [Novosphingobium sp. 28-62-57]OYZ98798.1 MAG: cell wall hydrolase [Novosphingobium sp. 17-62-8]